MFLHVSVTLIGALLISVPGALGGIYRHLGSILTPHAAFAAVHHNPNKPSQYDVSLSTFNPTPLSTDEVFVIRDVGTELAKRGANNLQADILADGLIWPNEVEPVPEDVFGTNMYWWVANGFLVPSKEDGSIGLIEADKEVNPAPYHDLTSEGRGNKWWYHRVYFVDIDGDGKKDMLSARADTSNGAGANTRAEMVYFRQPQTNPINTKWDVEILFDGPDALFRYEEIPMPGGVTRKAIFSCQYFAEKLVVSWTDNSGHLTFNNHRTIEAIEDNRYFDAEIVDINGDKKLDLLVSINSKTNGALVVFEIPEDWTSGTWTRHLIADGFKPHSIIVTEGMGSPGTTFTFKPDTTTRKKPLIMMTGDDDSNIYVFESVNDADQNNWSYTQKSIFEANSGTVGAPAVRDVDGDGLVEVFVPAYSDGRLHVLTYEP